MGADVKTGESAPVALRLVIPIRDEGARFGQLLADLANAPPAPPTEIVVVDDGSTPAMRELQARAVDAFAAEMGARGLPHRIRLVVAPANGGKGSAIRLGWGDGAGATWLGFVDGDGAVPAYEVWRLASTLTDAPSFDALLGSRISAPGRTVRRHLLRAIQGAVFARVANALLHIGVDDPQCGLKFFRASRLRSFLPVLRERGWTLDPELLLLLHNAGCTFREEPIDWAEHGSSKVRVGIDAARMFAQVVALRRRIGVRRAAPSAR